MRLRTLAAACLSAAAALTTTAVPASAATAPSTTPVLQDGLDGSTVSGVHDVTATSGAAYVRFEAHAGTADDTMVFEQVPVTSGQATWSWPTWGFGHATVVARDCADATAASCGSSSATAAVIAENPVDSTDLPTDPVLWNPTPPADGGDGPMQVNVVDSNGGGSLRLLWVSGMLSDVETVTPGQPTAMDFNSPSHATGPISLLRCSTLNTSICAPAAADSAPVEVRTRLLPSLAVASSEQLLSRMSDHNTKADETFTGTLGTEGISTSATWTVTDTDGNRLVVAGQPAQDVAVTDLLAGGDTPLDVRPDDAFSGVVIPDGHYRLVVTVHGTDRGHDFTGTVSSAFAVDATPDTVTSVSAGLKTFYPATDGYRD